MWKCTSGICWMLVISWLPKGKPFPEYIFFFSFSAFDHWLFSKFSKAGCPPLVMHTDFLSFLFFFSIRLVRVNTHRHYVYISSRIYTHLHTQTRNLMFLLSRRSMNKTGVQRLSEKQWETWGVLADLSAAVAVYSCHNLRVWTYRISSLLDDVCSENAHSFANLSVQTCSHRHTQTHTQTHT